jgi:inhibitor of KinA sporulation pathway (predicted exonuclease)
MKYILYLSTASHLMKEDELVSLLQVSRNNNKRKGLSGMLLYSEGTFIQLLEGDEDQLKSTYQAIEKDRRHYNIIKMLDGESSERHFPEWTMGFKSANAEEMEEFKGYINPSKAGFLTEEDAPPLITMLKTFADTNRM